MNQQSSPLTLTVVIPTYNRLSLLPRAIQSVLQQTYPHVTICVLDDGSTDGTLEWMEAFVQTESRVRYIRNPENIGVIRNFQQITQHVTGDFALVLGDDDYLEPNFVEVAMKDLAEYPEATVWHSRAAIVNERNEFIMNSRSAPRVQTGLEFICDWLTGNGICICATLMKTSILKTTIAFSLNTIVDSGAILCCAYRHTVVHNPQILANRTSWSNSVTQRTSIIPWLDSIEVLFNYMRQHIPEVNSVMYANYLFRITMSMTLTLPGYRKNYKGFFRGMGWLWQHYPKADLFRVMRKNFPRLLASLMLTDGIWRLMRRRVSRETVSTQE